MQMEGFCRCELDSRSVVPCHQHAPTLFDEAQEDGQPPLRPAAGGCASLKLGLLNGQ